MRKSKQNPKGAGRPKVEIDWELVGSLLEAGANATSIAARLGISRESLYKRCTGDNNCEFSTFSQQKKESGDDLLRVKQFEVAMSGDKVMLIWLGKQRLGQSDRLEHTGKDGGPIETATRVILPKE